MQIKVGRGRGGKQSCQQAAGAHLGVSQCAFQRLNFSIISDFYSRNTKRQQIAPLVNIWTTKRKLKNKFHTVLVFLSDAVTGRCHFQHKGIRWGRHCVVLFSTGKEKKDSVASRLAVRWPGHPYLWPRLAKTSKHPPPIRLGRGGGSALVKMTGTALSEVFQDSAKGGLPKTTDVHTS